MTKEEQKTQRHEEKRRSIICGAITLLKEVGVKDFSIVELARCLAMSKPSIYYYFDGDNDLLIEVYRELLRNETVAINATRHAFVAKSPDLVLIRDLEAVIGHVEAPETEAFCDAINSVIFTDKVLYMEQLLPQFRRVEG